MGFKFSFVENILVRLLMVGAVIYAIQKDTLLGLLTLLAVVTLLVERNQAIITSLPGMSGTTKISQQRNLYPMAPPQDIFTHIKDTDNYDNNDIHDASVTLEDNIPDLKEGPTNHDAPSFFKNPGVL